MLEFFRKYQSFIYIIVTTVIVISFSFFGTYSTIVSNPIRDQVVFTAIDGSSVKRSDLDEMVIFISTDAHDKLLFGGMWGPNFLNDGVIRKDLLTTGVAQILSTAYSSDLDRDLDGRLQKEKAYAPYVHPKAAFINAEAIWNQYAPAIKNNLDLLRATSSATDLASMDARAQLYLAQSQFPPQFLQQVLAYQEKQFSFVTHDGNLDRSDLSVFGYHTLEDWFGPRFIRLAAQFIINGAKLAEEKGYEVSKQEALADLLHNAQVSYEQNANSPYVGVANSGDYFNEQLRRMGMDQSQAVKVWRQILLYRRLSNDIGNSVFVDPLLYTQFNAYANEAVVGNLYKLPRDLHFSNYRSLQKFEIYLNAISKRSEGDLLPPQTFLSEAEVARKYPQLVQKRYLLKTASLDKNTLQAKVSLKDTWNWEVENWDTLTKQFPELGIKNATTREERLAALETLDDQTRLRADNYARATIVDLHPEWRVEALNSASEKTASVGLSAGLPSSYFIGLEESEELMKKLDTQDSITYSADDRHYYKITVLDRADKPSILTYAEANQQGILDALLDRELNNYYVKNREAYASQFRKEEGAWKAYDDVQSEIADLYFAKILTAIQKNYPHSEELKNSGHLIAPLRFYSYLNHLREQAEKNAASIEDYVSMPEAKTEETKLARVSPLENQWKLVKSEEHIHRGDGLSDQAIFAAEPNSWSQVNTAPNGDLSVFHILKKGEEALDTAAAAKKLNQIKQLLAAEAKQNSMGQVIKELKEKNALSLAYLNQPIETVEELEQAPEEME